MTLHMLAAFLVLGGAAPSQATAGCDPTDHGCKARRSERRAASAIKPDDQATYLRSAHLSYLALYDKTGEVHDLCSARRAFDASLAVKGQTADERARTQKLRGDLVDREHKAATPCKVAKQQRVSRPDAPPVVASGTNPKVPLARSPADTVEPTSEPPALLTSTATPEPPSAPESSPSAVHLPPPSTNGPRPDETLMAIPNRRTPPKSQADGLRPGRGLVIAGGVMLGAGVALTAGAGHMGRRMNETRQEYFTLVDSISGFGTPDQDAKAAGLLGDYKAMQTQALALGVAAGTTIVVAAVLVGVGGRRMARAASRTALVPVPGGLALFTRF
ncbi:MAG: hypothetical protein JNL82_24075 [Myxococcales bacterium]|nr:hypothetical protein [Myxococcales bacterium]